MFLNGGPDSATEKKGGEVLQVLIALCIPREPGVDNSHNHPSVRPDTSLIHT